MITSAWYNYIYPYINFRGDHRRRFRAETVDQFNPSYGHTVIDLCCGDGYNFPYLLKKVGSTGRIIGIDCSSKLLEKAKSKYKNNKNIFYLCIDANNITFEKVKEVVNDFNKADGIICTLGLTVVDNWENVFYLSYELLKERGKYAIMDIFIEKNNFSNFFIKSYSLADSKRKVWIPFENTSKNFKIKFIKVQLGQILIAIGEK